MPNPTFLYKNSRFFETLLEGRFLFDLRRSLVLRNPPSLLNVLRSEVDAFGFDLVLALGDKSIHVQMKTRSGLPPPNKYAISEQLWGLPSACVVWMLYDAEVLEPSSYYVFGLPLPEMTVFDELRRPGFRGVKMQAANYKNLTIEELATLLFPLNVTEKSVQTSIFE
jgi:hypothetical protein